MLTQGESIENDFRAPRRLVIDLIFVCRACGFVDPHGESFPQRLRAISLLSNAEQE